MALQAPNKRSVVEDLSVKFADEFREAHADYPRPAGPGRDAATEFMHIVVRELRKTDKNFYMNVKQNKGNGKFSQDAIAYVRAGMDQKEVYDIISAAGSSNAAVAWNMVGLGPKGDIALPEGENPTPNPPASSPPNRLNIVHQVDNKNPGLFKDHPTAFTRLVAEELAKEHSLWGLYRPKGEDQISRDKLGWNVKPVQFVDIISGAGGDNPRLGWQSPKVGDGRWVPVERQPDPQPDPDPDPKPDPPKDVEARLTALERRVSALEQARDLSDKRMDRLSKWASGPR